MSCLVCIIFASCTLRLIHPCPMALLCLIDKLMKELPWLIITHPLFHSLLFQHSHWTTSLSGAHWWDLLKIMCSNSLPPIFHSRWHFVYSSSLINICQAQMLLGLRPFLMSNPMLAIPLPFSYMCSQDNYPPEVYWRVGECYLLVDATLDVMQPNLLIISSIFVPPFMTFEGPCWLMCIKSL